jgi:type II secretion system protein G
LKSFKAFTLIELLIVVAIIAILAAIAVPNFIEAQVRAKVSRTFSDMRSLKTAIESYAVDNNIYPETDFGVETYPNPGIGMIRLTTPVSYITTIPLSPWEEKNLGYAGWPAPNANRKNANKFEYFLWVRARVARDAGGAALFGVTPVTPAIDVDSNFALDRLVYLRGQTAVNTTNLQFAASGVWELKSVGPNNHDDRDSQQLNNTGLTIATQARIYDPTNGTTSAGDMVTYQDTSIQPSGG